MILVISSARKQKHVSHFRHSSRNDLSGVQECCCMVWVTFGYMVLAGLYPGSQISAIGHLLKKKLFLMYSPESGFLSLFPCTPLRWWYAKLILCYSERKEIKMCDVEMSISEMEGAENRKSLWSEAGKFFIVGEYRGVGKQPYHIVFQLPKEWSSYICFSRDEQ